MTSDQPHTPLTDAYIGPAALVTGRGDIPVMADLFLEPADLALGAGGAPRAWSGRLEAAEDVNIFAVAVGPCTLRMPDGRQATVVPDSVAVGTGVIPVAGVGPAPFGDA
ncbi:hypothetical protein SAMN05216251_110114 [Actinacidiphila alni]|uniref:Uncharacterized protein n=1 Tax=Actinacidiphila alni TaxID=380248 RepID=A0A1I2H798_9ACTN|nr:hypothetical protein [Actinacidiphila alni]SFF25253.1 hypothetical protein SAMN05216251_110114 [Actinacidiphila alni]